MLRLGVLAMLCGVQLAYRHSTSTAGFRGSGSKGGEQASVLIVLWTVERDDAVIIDCVRLITRRHVEAFKPWLAARPGLNKPRLTRPRSHTGSGTLRMFFVRIKERGCDEAPPRVAMFPGDLPRQDHPLPKALDDATATKLLRAAQNDRRVLIRVTVEMLLRTGLRVNEYTSLRTGAVVHIGAGPWLHVPVGKLHETDICRCTRSWSPSSTARMEGAWRWPRSANMGQDLGHAVLNRRGPGRLLSPGKRRFRHPECNARRQSGVPATGTNAARRRWAFAVESGERP